VARLTRALPPGRARTIFPAVAHAYQVDGGHGGRVVGALEPDEVDGRAEWVPIRRGGLLDALESRLGSEVSLRKVVLAVLCPLRPLLEGPPLDAILARLPPTLAREVREGELNLDARVAPPSGANDYLLEVARLLQQPPRRAAVTLRAALGAAKSVLSQAEVELVAFRLPADLARLWLEAH
jgi:uncharacterized protein (DUF2267 family)